ncbi:hypothetical protein AB0G67_48890 [Streptomyces sp. NPDC021056]|uniref:hypothetical protein n=1 Tax=Streptomyces sp. NPDC021056 TaxID=3155012 RepID=UPI0034010A4A
MAATSDARSAVTPNRVHLDMSRRLTLLLLLAVATGAIAANLYYAQPLLDVIARSLGTSAGAAGAIVTVTQLGFAAGLVFVLPLADIVKRRSLLTALLLLDAAALAVVGLAPGLGVALAAYAVLGLANVAAHLLVPAAAQLADACSACAAATAQAAVVPDTALGRTPLSPVTARPRSRRRTRTPGERIRVREMLSHLAAALPEGTSATARLLAPQCALRMNSTMQVQLPQGMLRSLRLDTAPQQWRELEHAYGQFDSPTSSHTQ